MFQNFTKTTRLGMMPDHILVMMIFAGTALFTAGQIGMVISAFISGIGWGLAYVFLPVIGLILNVYYRWNHVKFYFCMLVFGVLFVVIGFFGGVWNPKSQIAEALNRFHAYKGVYSDVARVQRLTRDLALIMNKERLHRPLTLNKQEAARLEEAAKLRKEGPIIDSLVEAVRSGDAGLVREWAAKDRAHINSFTASGTTPLMEAAAYGYAEIVRILLENGADPRIVNAENKTALTFAEENMRASIVEILSQPAAAS